MTVDVAHPAVGAADLLVDRGRLDLEHLVVGELLGRRPERTDRLHLERDQAAGQPLHALGGARLRLLDQERPALAHRQPDRVVVLDVAEKLHRHAQSPPRRRHQRRAEVDVAARPDLVDDDPRAEGAGLGEDLLRQLRVGAPGRLVQVERRRDPALERVVALADQGQGSV